MPAYLMVRAHVTDMEQYRQYMKLTPAIAEKYGGVFLVRGGGKVILEGPDAPERIVLLRFDSVEAARRMYNSEEYQAAIKLRAGAAEASFIVLEGVE
ncbi:MAG: DUF1330 domain-containing protein [Chloroflexota bacterium]|nr:DUF1330 domain-containing protein [Chloroflexota bacterium]MDE2947532.1 DUF1330 domain-containing protein [Chloroflexota bacterium]